MNAALLTILLLWSTPGNAPKPGSLDAKQLPVEMTAKGGLKIDLEKKIGYAKHDVVIKRADVTVCCDAATARYSRDRIESVECRGRVVIVRPDGTVARADRAVFQADQDKLRLTGLAKLRSEDTELEGDEIVYDILKDKLIVEGRNSRFRFVPQDLPTMKLERTCPP